MQTNNLGTSYSESLGVSSSSWYDSQLDLMSEVNVYGSLITSSSLNDIGVDYTQYAIFQLRPDLINSDGKSGLGYWLKSVANNVYFAVVNGQGIAGVAGAHYENAFGVRPRFLIG